MSKVAKAALGLMSVTMFSKVLGFLRETILVAVYGASASADAYITSMNIPNVIFATIGAALGTTFIPLFYEIEKCDGKERALNFSNNVFNIVIMISFIIAILGFLFAEPLTRVFAMDFSGETLKIATRFTKIMIFGIVFIGLMNIMTCWLQIKGDFTIPGMVGLPYNIIIIISIILSAKGNLDILAIGTLLAISSQFIFLYPFAAKNQYRYKMYINIKDKYIKKMLYLIIPVFIGVGVNQINTVVDRSLASTLGDGIITILNSANRLNTFITGILVVAIVSVVYPLLSKLSSEGNIDEFTKTIRKSINIIILLLIPISVGAIILSEPVVRIVFERGKFNSQSTYLTSVALAYYSIGMVGFGLREILNRIFYSLKDTKTPMINGTISMIMNIILNVLLINFMGHGGLAFATSISSLICVIMLFRSLRRKIGYFGQNNIIKTTLKCIIASFIMAIITKKTYLLFSSLLGIGTIQEIIAIIVSVSIGVIIYGILIILLKIDEVNILLDKFNSRKHKITLEKQYKV